MISEFLAPKTQPVWHHFALTQRVGEMAKELHGVRDVLILDGNNAITLHH